MSLKYMARVWEETELNGNLLLVMLALADYSDGEGKCWPKVATIAKRARVSHRQAQRYLSELAAKGYITRVSNMGKGRAVVYTVHPTGRGVNQVALQTEDSDDDMDTGDNSGSVDEGMGDSYMSPPTGDSYMSPPSEPVKREPSESDDGAGSGITTWEVVAAYENEIGLLTPMIGESLYDAVEEYTGRWVLDSIRLAVRYNKRSWAYCEAILKRWKREGRDMIETMNTENAVKYGTISLVGGDLE